MKLINRYRTKELYFRFLAALLIVSFIPLIVITIYVFFNTQSKAKEQVLQTNRLYFEQTVNIFNSIINQIDVTFNQLSLDSNIKNYDAFLIEKDYGSSYVSIDDSELVNVSLYYQVKLKVLERMHLAKLSSDFIDRIYYYNSSKDNVLTDSGLQYKLSEFYDKDLISSYITNKDKLRFFLSHTSSNGEKGIYIIYHSLMNMNDIFVFRLAIDKMLDKIWGYNNNDYLVILNSDGEQLYTIDDSDDNTDILEINKNLSVENTILNFKDKYDNTLFFIKKPELVFAKRIYTSEISKGVGYVNATLIIVFFVVIIITILLVSVISKKIYIPFSNILNNLKLMVNAGNSDDGEIKLVNNIIKQISLDREQIEKRMQALIPSYKNKFVISYINNIPFTENELSENMKFLNVDIEQNDYFIVLIELYYENIEDDDYIKNSAYNEMIAEQIMNSVFYKYKFVASQVQPLKYVILVNASSGQASEIYNVCEEISDILKNSSQICSCMGISNFAGSRETLSYAYREAEEALNYGIITGKGKIISASSVSFNNKSGIAFSEKINNIIEFALKGNAEKAIIVLNDIRRIIKSNEQNISYNKLQFFIYLLLSKLFELVEDKNYEMKAIFLSKNPYEDMHSIQNIDELFELFASIINNIIGLLAADGISDNNYYIDNVIKIVDKDFGADMCLSVISDRLGVNAAYLSRLFKSHMKVNFIEYLTKVRIEKSKQMLRDNMKIKDIAALLSYSNVEYYIRLFKQQTGITPGEYKKKS